MYICIDLFKKKTFSFRCTLVISLGEVFMSLAVTPVSITLVHIKD